MGPVAACALTGNVTTDGYQIGSSPMPAIPAGVLQIAVLITCYNRYSTTREAIARLLVEVDTIADARFTVFLLDDDSPDQTGQRIVAEWPAVPLTLGDGTLFWNRGMHRLVEVARAAASFDAFLCLNDDVHLINGRLGVFLATFVSLRLQGISPILVGAMADPINGRVTYSGMRRVDPCHPLGLVLVEPSDSSIVCDTANGNLMLVPRAVMDAVGNFDRRYRHAIGDVDLSYRAARAGYATVLAPGVYGCCVRNDIVCRTLERPSIRQRFRFFFGPKFHPAGFTTFFREYAPEVWVRYALRIWLRAAVGTLSPRLYDRLWRADPLVASGANPHLPSSAMTAD